VIEADHVRQLIAEALSVSAQQHGQRFGRR
jgi:hypothetical protein